MKKYCLMGLIVASLLLSAASAQEAVTGSSETARAQERAQVLRKELAHLIAPIRPKQIYRST